MTKALTVGHVAATVTTNPWVSDGTSHAAYQRGRPRAPTQVGRTMAPGIEPILETRRTQETTNAAAAAVAMRIKG